MKILLVGKYPPIQGGVSAQTYLYARELAEKGHEVFVVTNAREVEDGYRMFMRGEDWLRCEESFSPGSLKVYWTAPADSAQKHIPFHKAFFSKLFSLGLEVAAENKIDAIFSFYLEPYGLVGHALSRELGVPHVVKTAGSDVGRLWPHPQFRPAFDRVFRDAAMSWTSGGARDELIARCGVDADRIHVGGRLVIPESIFRPDVAPLDLTALGQALGPERKSAASTLGRPRPDFDYVGIYGKISENKGTFDLVNALALLVDEQPKLGLLIMGGAGAETLGALRDLIRARQMEERVAQIPFLPYWRVPEFIARCTAVCCLERDFPIEIHNPVIAREVMLSGGCLIGSTEILRKMPNPERLVDGYNCIAVEKVKEPEHLAAKLAPLLRGVLPRAAIRTRAHDYAQSVQDGHSNLLVLEELLERATGARAARRPPSNGKAVEPAWSRAAKLVLSRCRESGIIGASDPPEREDEARGWLRRFAERLAADAEEQATDDLLFLAEILRVCVLLSDLPEIVYWPSEREFSQSVFRLNGAPSRPDDRGVPIFDGLAPFPIGNLNVLKLRHDAASVLGAIRSGSLPERAEENPSGVAVQVGIDGFGPKIFVLDEISVDILLSSRACAGGACTTIPEASAPSTASSMSELFATGLIGLK